MTQIRKRLSVEEAELVNQHRALQKECKEKGIPIDSVRHYWHKGKNFSIFSKNNSVSWEKFRQDFIKDASKYAPRYPTIKRKPSGKECLLVLDPADIHFGKIARVFESGENYNIKVARDRVISGISGIVEKAHAFNIDKILLVLGNDILHIDNPRRTTTSGTPQDTDGMWYDAYLMAKQTIVDVVESLLPIADVHIQYDPSNHDYMSGFYLADSIYSWFSRSKNVHFNNSIAHRKYFRYGKNLIGTTHGDGAKIQDLGLLMAQESANDWASTKHRYFYIHHYHSKLKNDQIGITVECLRSPSGTDSWHHRNGYQHAPKAIEGFVHDKDHGQIARFTHIF